MLIAPQPLGYVRFFLAEDVLADQVPVPYNRDGNGDYWFFSFKLTTVNGVQVLAALTCPPDSLNEGPDLSARILDPLRGLSIFSGGGNLDRGLEDGGAVKFIGAIDISKEALLTQKANAQHPEDLKLYWGSVDDYLDAVLRGENIELIARIGDISFVAAGSPCPGFSTLQMNWKSEQSLLNASHVTR